MRNTKTVARIVASSIVVISVSILAGLSLGIDWLHAGLPGYNSMKFNTALCFTFCGILLWQDALLLKPFANFFYNTLPAVMAAIGLLTLAEHLFRVDLFIDSLFFKDSRAGGGFHPLRMSGNSALNFLLLATIFFCLPRRQLHWFIFPAVAFIQATSVIVILNHFSGLEYFKSLPFFSVTAFHTALLFCVVGFAILFSPKLYYIKLGFQTKILASLIAICLVLGLVFSAFHKSNKQFIQTADWVHHITQVILVNQQILNEAISIESGARGYVITGNEAFLNTYIPAVANIQNLVRQLRELTKDNPAQQKRINELERLVERSKQVRNHFIDTRKKLGRDQTVAEVSGMQGLAISNSIRQLFSQIEAEEKRLLAIRKAASEKTFENPGRFIILFLLLIFLLLVLTFFTIVRNKKFRDKAEAELMKSRQLINAIVENTANPISVRDLQGNYLLANKAMQHLLRKDESVMKGNHTEVLPGATAKELKKIDEEVVRSRAVRTAEEKVTVNDAVRYFNTCKFPVFDEDDQLYAVGSVATDVTKIKEAEKQIRELNKDLEKQVEQKTREVIEKEKQYRFLLQNMNEGIQVIGFDWKYLFVNESAAHQMQYTVEDLVGSSMVEKHPGIEKTELFKVLEQSMVERKQLVYENEFVFTSGHSRWFELSIQPVPEGLFVLSMDITDRKMAEEKLMFALEAGEIGWWELDLSSNVAQRNHLHDKIFGYDKPLDHWDTDIFLQHVHPDDQLIAQKALEQAAITQHLDMKVRIKRADGVVRWISVQGKIMHAHASGGRMPGTVIDITELKQAEERLARHAEELKKSNTELERFAYVASHDLQEPVRMVSSFLNLLEKRLNGQLDETNKQYIDFALDGAGRMKVLIQDLLQYSRISHNSEKLEEVDLNEVMAYVRRLLDAQVREANAILNIQELPVIKANATLINQLFVNLVSNALKFRSEKLPVIEVGVQSETKRWVFFVRDNGIGIDPKFFDKIFIIFQRLHNKTEYAGTGIGLAICKKIVETHRGTIWIESTPREGSCFYFSIPKNL